MHIEHEVLLVLQTQRTVIARDWQAAVRMVWCNRPKAEFGRGSDTYKAVLATLSVIESKMRNRLSGGQSSNAAPDSPISDNDGDTILNTRPMWAQDDSVKDELQDCDSIEAAAEHWSCLPYGWSEIQTMIRLAAEAIEDAMSKCKLGDMLGKYCALEIAAIGEAAAGQRIHRLEQDIANTREQAVLTQHMAGRFISNASHDLRTPLTAILGFTELLVEGNYGELDDEQAGVVGHVYNSAQNLLEIVNNLLDIMQIQAGKLNLRSKRVDIAAVLHAVYSLLASLATRRNVNFTIDLPDDLGTMTMDENIVRHIVYHLLSSALRSAPTGGYVGLSAERTTTSVTIITQDTALKLPQEAIDNMLGMVPLLENSPVRGYEGWEVGLALVRRYVEIHEGTMEIDNREDVGTTFRVTLHALKSDANAR